MILLIGSLLDVGEFVRLLEQIDLRYIKLGLITDNEDFIHAVIKQFPREANSSFYCEEKWHEAIGPKQGIGYFQDIPLGSKVLDWKEILGNWQEKNHPIERLIFRFELDRNILTNTAFIRAFKISFANYFEGEIPYLMGTTVRNNEAVDRNDQLLTNGICSLAMAYGGMDYIDGLPYKEQNDLAESVYNMNMAHIYNLETDFKESSDPFAGSYYMENLTYHILQG